MIDLVIGQILAAFNFVLSVALAVLSFRLYRHRRQMGNNDGWLLICFIFLSLYWAALYMYAFVSNIPITGTFAMYARPAMTVTFGMMLAEVIIRGD